MLETYGMEELSLSEIEDVNGGGVMIDIFEAVWNFTDIAVRAFITVWRAFW